MTQTTERTEREQRLRIYFGRIEALRDPVLAVQLEGMVKHFNLDMQECRTVASCSKCEKRQRCASAVA